MELLVKKHDLIQIEVELLRSENNLLRMSPRNSLFTISRTILNIKNVSDLLNEYSGLGDDFERWKTQVNLLERLLRYL